MTRLFGCVLGGLALLAPPATVRPIVKTDPVGDDADDPAIWVNVRAPEKSVVYGTNKTKAPKGAIVAFDLQGHTIQTIAGIDRPNNCDVETGFRMGVERADILVLTERLQHRLRVFRINPNDGKLTDVSGNTDVFAGESGEASEPMGVSLYRRPKDGTVFAVVSPKTGPKTNYLGEYRLAYNPATRQVDAKLVRRFGAYSGRKEIESVAVDDELGFVYYSDERFGTRKYRVDPDAPEAGREVAVFNTQGFQADHEGIALVAEPGGKGYLVCTDQIQGDSEYHVYDRGEGNRPLGVFRLGADETDGIDATATPLGPQFPQGLFVAMDSGPRRFVLASWADVKRRLKLR